MNFERFASEVQRVKRILGRERFAELEEDIRVALTKIDFSEALYHCSDGYSVLPHDLAALVLRQLEHDWPGIPILSWQLKDKVRGMIAIMSLGPWQLQSREIGSLQFIDYTDQVVGNYHNYPLAIA